MCWYNRQMAAAATTLASIVTFTSIFSSDRIKINSAGISAAQPSRKLSENRLCISTDCPAVCGAAKPAARYTAQVTAKGTAAVRSMRRMFWNTSVPVSSATSRALVDTGEHRSPKKMPDKMAPPVKNSLTPMARHSAVSIPIRTKMMRMFRMVRMPSSDILRICAAVYFLKSAYAQKIR